MLINNEDCYQAIKEGVSQAIWQIATNATDMPCQDFYEMIKQGIKEGIESFLTHNPQVFEDEDV